MNMCMWGCVKVSAKLVAENSCSNVKCLMACMQAARVGGQGMATHVHPD